MLVTVGPDNETGFRKHLEHLAYLVEESRFIAVSERGPESLGRIIDANPDLTIIGARNWIKRNNQILEEIPGKKGLMFVGPLGQDEISQVEIENFHIFMKWLDSGKIDYMFMGCEDFAHRLNREDVLYLPAPYGKELPDFTIKKKPEKNIVSILNDKAIHKNILNSVAGISLSENLDEFVINGAKEEYMDLFHRFGLDPCNVGFLEKGDYYQKIDESSLLLHLSYSEGLCYATLEALSSGTPVLVSDAMPWFYHPQLHINNPADHHEIARTIDQILTLPDKEYKHLSKECRDLAERKINKNNKDVLLTYQRVYDGV